MSKPRVGSATRPATRANDELIAAIADRTRRQALLALRDRPEPIDTTALAAQVAAAVSGEDLDDVTRGDRDAFHVTLVHRHLPRLDDAGLVDWGRDDGVVAATDHPALDDTGFRELLEGAAENWDAVLRAIQPERRRLVLAVLDDAGELDRRTLARRVLARESGDPAADVAESDLEDVLVSLRHRHVPALQRAGLVSADGETIRAAGHPDLEADLLAAEPFDLRDPAATGAD